MRGLRFVLFTSYYYGDQIKDYEIGGTCSMHGEMSIQILVGKSEGNRPLQRHAWMRG
jgi:hypothetical protein